MSRRDKSQGFLEITPDAVMEMLVDYDDRTAAIMAISLVESLLQYSIAYKFRRYPTDADMEQLFSGYGPLATLSGKIAISYYIGIINADMRHDLQILKNLRNDFAHEFSKISFGTNFIADRCHSLKFKAHVMKGAIEDKCPKGARGEFVRSISKVLSGIMIQFAFSSHEKQLLKAHNAALVELATNSIQNDEHIF